MSSRLHTIQQFLQQDEILLLQTQCSLHTFLHRGAPRPGTLAVTNQRILFIYTGLNNTISKQYEEFLYENITDIKEKKTLFESRIVFYHEHNWIPLQYIHNKDTQKRILQMIQEKVDN
ncbi:MULTISPECIES: PH domain-containing protein [unclassified Bacillus (in: firmicutes)]|uniref:PH domain-containing protein n=1 Tax=unclassified Bacillus (in: firmicutes) TaxID=185979 RepID=UPI0033655D98